eukprot:363852-Chlamydomonas_euryale.AAC.3
MHVRRPTIHSRIACSSVYRAGEFKRMPFLNEKARQDNGGQDLAGHKGAATQRQPSLFLQLCSKVLLQAVLVLAVLAPDAAPPPREHRCAPQHNGTRTGT